MGNEDIRTSLYFEDNERFADLANGAFFQGENIIKPEFLEPADKELLYPWTKKGKKTIRDNVKKYYRDTLICIYIIEHQQNIDYHMVIRNMLSEALEYDRQWRALRRIHKEKHDLHTKHEVISGMTKTDRFAPVLTLVAYYGQDKWDGPTCLHDLLSFDGEDSPLCQYVENYHIHLFDYHDYDDFDMFHTELRQVFSFLKNATNRSTLRKLIAENPAEYYNMSTDTYELINTITNTSGLLCNMQFPDDTSGGTNMWRAFEELIEEGKIEGREDGIRAFVLDYTEEGFSRTRILEKLQKRFSLSPEQAEDYFEKFSPAAVVR